MQKMPNLEDLNDPSRIECDFLTVGTGVTGAAAVYISANYTNFNHIVAIEKYDAPGTVNSHHSSNAQTLHEGDTETNYSLHKAKKIHFASKLIRSYIKDKPINDVYTVTDGMVIGVGKKECDLLRKRHAEFKEEFPKLELIYGDQIRAIEKEIMSGRKKTGPDDINALYRPDRVCVNYQRLAQEFIKDAQAVTDKKVSVFFNSPLEDIWQTRNGYGVCTANGMVIDAGVVEFAAGPYSLKYAQKFGYKTNLRLLNVAGNFYWVKRDTNIKAYTVQDDGIPFAAFHIDRNMVTGQSQLGPTTQIILEMIRRKPETFPDYMQVSPFTNLSDLSTFVKMVRQNHLAWYGLKNILFEYAPGGKYLVLREARKIIPDLRYDELELLDGHGGSRSQIIDPDAENPLVMGDYNITGWRLISNTTPSPGASVCLMNALRDVLKAVKYHGGKFKFDMERFKKDFGVTDEQIAAAYDK